MVPLGQSLCTNHQLPAVVILLTEQSTAACACAEREPRGRPEGRPDGRPLGRNIVRRTCASSTSIAFPSAPPRMEAIRHITPGNGQRGRKGVGCACAAAVDHVTSLPVLVRPLLLPTAEKVCVLTTKFIPLWHKRVRPPVRYRSILLLYSVLPCLYSRKGRTKTTI